MGVDLKGRSLLTLRDYSADEILYLLNLATWLKQRKAKGESGDLLKGKNIVLIFEKPSTRTRSAFDVACHDVGGNPTLFENSHLGYKESIEDTAKVLGCYYDGIEFRGFNHRDVEVLARESGVPVWNGLTDLYHPTQALADILTIKEFILKPLSSQKIVYVGDPSSNTATSLLIAAAKLGMTFIGLGPKSMWPNNDVIKEMQAIAEKNHANISFTNDMFSAVVDADVIYTDVWVSMGQEDESIKRIVQLSPYQVTMSMLKATHNPHVKFMHCLPAFHDLKTTVGKDMYAKYGLTEMEVTDEVFKSDYSIVLEQAENRMHTIKAVMVATLVGNVQ